MSLSKIQDGTTRTFAHTFAFTSSELFLFLLNDKTTGSQFGS